MHSHLHLKVRPLDEKGSLYFGQKKINGITGFNGITLITEVDLAALTIDVGFILNLKTGGETLQIETIYDVIDSPPVTDPFSNSRNIAFRDVEVDYNMPNHIQVIIK